MFGQLSHIDAFFYYGQLDLLFEIDSDLLQGLMQPKRSMLYHRDFGAGVPSYENFPESLAMQIELRFAVVEWISRRNQEVGDGTSGTRDRRAAASQSTISVESPARGEVEVRLQYIPYASYKNARTIRAGTLRPGG